MDNKQTALSLAAQAPAYDYVYWRDALAGQFGPVHDSDPQAGFWRRRMFRGGPFVPAAIWRDAASGEMLCLIDGKSADAAEAWTYLCRYPVTEEAYRAKMDGKPWPDEDVAVTASLTPPPAGDNNPPQDEAELLKAQIEAAATNAEVYKDIRDDETASRAQSARSRLLELSGTADKKREALKKPHLEAGKAIDATWQPLVKQAKAAADDIRSALSAHENRKLAAQREADRKAAEEARKAEEASRAAEEAGKPIPPPQAAPPPTPAPEPVQTQIRGAYGRAAAKKMVKVVTVTDQDAAYGFLKTHPEMKALIAQLAKRAVDAGLTVPGTEVKEEIDVR